MSREMVVRKGAFKDRSKAVGRGSQVHNSDYREVPVFERSLQRHVPKTKDRKCVNSLVSKDVDMTDQGRG